MNQVQKLLIIGFVWPEPNSSAAGGRMMQLISLFKEQGFSITFVSPAQDSDFMVDLEKCGVDKKSIELNNSSFDVFIKELNPTVVLFDRFMMEEQFGWRVAENCPDALRLLDTEDLHCLRLARQKAFKEKRPFNTTDLFLEDVAKREIASILRCDLSLMISEFEMELLESVFKIDKNLLYYLPFLLEPIDIVEIHELPSFEERKNFIFIGNFLHEPNWNAVQYLKETIWALIKKQLPEAILHIYGAYPSQKVLQLHNNKEGFLIMGRAIDAQDVVKNSRVVLAPLRFGAGIKGKLLEAMQCGTPSVTTFIGSESMHDDLPWNGFVVDSVADFTDAAVRLCQDKTIWLKAQQNGITIINQRYLKELFKDDFAKKVKMLQSDLQKHRLTNFMGAMLQHHTLNSTKYMSRWIEVKNK
ncbi:glycosyltransferase family 4 protein [Flavobacterium gawalongense]|uniref:Glycosyltransferase family 4 protein n=1 Tax=Flavobacterium gawalongense TaxID=2594432 RepID=A0A553BF67_9FLAO|nr:glycosyltransferase family 4 protein [Flavobacterium gawalongense]TRW99744.1 glycosyltransferase family 4 protein [Flavobacterium gawalongense]TRX03869.1 glycosyltransferase family 4 protein [Flavobacterium gawalongense]TRX06896.1 glycosyltransferase family 4 protein [Flavobacterium gawalongense]TRX07609.1 glycosyltransferase family 4 protein [Flavobacterium gawalongense]TRX23485.1 glycosyltransferase family 4 protein [Flavobacterium gawalongense]